MTIAEIVKKTFSYADMFTMSAKKTRLSTWAVLLVLRTGIPR